MGAGHTGNTVLRSGSGAGSRLTHSAPARPDPMPKGRSCRSRFDDGDGAREQIPSASITIESCEGMAAGPIDVGALADQD